MKVLIVGAGKLGFKLAESLSSSGNDVAVMDTDPDALERISENLDVMPIKASGIQVEALQNLNISRYDLAIAVTESDETNIIICTLSKKLGCKKAIARIRNPEYARQQSFIKTNMGIDHIVNPELATSNEIIRYLLKSYSFFSGDFAEGRVLMVDFNASELPGFVGKKIMDLENINGLLIIAILRNGEMIIPHGANYIEEDDKIYVIGKSENINNVAEKYKMSLPIKDIRRVMVLGGGIIGYYLSEKLTSQGISVKLIEQDLKRCEYLSENLPGTLVIHGDGTDESLLRQEDISSMDAFIGVTGYDEENLLMTLMAKQAGVKKVIAKVSKPSYVRIIEKLGVDVALSPVDITASDILKYIGGGRIVSVSLILGGKAEVTEIIADKKMKIVNKPLSRLGLPKGIIIGAIVREGIVTIPNGSSMILPGDRFVVFCLSSELPSLESFIKIS
jgi:trk system potassium uptake protein TrkA